MATASVDDDRKATEVAMVEVAAHTGGDGAAAVDGTPVVSVHPACTTRSADGTAMTSPCEVDDTSGLLACDIPKGYDGSGDDSGANATPRGTQRVHLRLRGLQLAPLVSSTQRMDDDKRTPQRPVPLLHQLLAEVMGTFIIVSFGTGVVAAAVLNDGGAQAGLWQVAVVWGVAVAVAIFCTAAVSGAHLNPAVTLMFAVVNGTGWLYVLPFWAAQLVGGVLGGTATYLCNYNHLEAFEESHDIVRGDPGSELSAMVLHEFFPNPATPFAAAGNTLPPGFAFAVEAWATGLLCFVILALTDKRNPAAGPAAPALIGLTVSILISLFAPLTQAGLNPARDFGPRLVAYMAGWGDVAFPGPRDGWWVYVVGPLVGGPLGGLLFRWTMKLSYAAAAPGSPATQPHVA